MPGDELRRLARLPPEARWASVRATQRMLASDAPPGTATTLPGPAAPMALPPTYVAQGRTYLVPGSWRSSALGWGGVRTAPAPSAPSSRGGSSSRDGRGARGLALLAPLVVVVGGAAAVFVLAGTEGARYDGWVGVPPDEALFLDRADGSVVAVPLASLTPELADGATGATLYEGREPRYVRVARAPLDRVGFTAQSSTTAAAVPGLGGGDGAAVGFGGRFFFGGYAVPQLGIGASVDVLATARGDLLAGLGGEVQVMPTLWAGAYLGAGALFGDAGEATPRLRGAWYLRGGALLELPLTTRLAASLRLGVARLDAPALTPLYAPEASLGLSLY